MEGHLGALGSANPWNPRALEPRGPQPLSPSFYDGLAFTVDTAVEDPKLQGLIKKHVLDVRQELKEMRFAVADLTAGGKPLFAGNNLSGPAGDTRNIYTEPTFGGSLVKIVAMLTAYQLQYDLNVLAKMHVPALTTREELFQTAWETWAATQDPATGDPLKDLAKGSALATRGGLIKKNGKDFNLRYMSWNGVKTWKRKVGGKVATFIDGAPNLENIFDVIAGSPLKVEFKHGADPEKGGQALGEFGGPAGKPFYERMYAMIHMSNNITTASCVMDLGYLYIASTLLRSGLFSPLLGGLWLSASYPGLTNTVGWIQNPVSQHDQVRGGKVNTSRRYQVSSPLAAAAFGAPLAKRRLVSFHASDEMLYLMDKNKHTGTSGTWSPIIASLQNQGRTVDRGCSKLGLVGRSTGDCAYIKRVRAPAKRPDGGWNRQRDIEYVVALVDWNFVDSTILDDLTRGIDDAIEELNK